MCSNMQMLHDSSITCVTMECLFCVTDDYEDDDEDEGATATAQGAAAGAKSSVSKLAEQATDAAGVNHG